MEQESIRRWREIEMLKSDYDSLNRLLDQYKYYCKSYCSETAERYRIDMLVFAGKAGWHMCKPEAAEAERYQRILSAKINEVCREISAKTIWEKLK